MPYWGKVTFVYETDSLTGRIKILCTPEAFEDILKLVITKGVHVDHPECIVEFEERT